MPGRKRNHEEMQTTELHKEASLLERLRNMWEFASLMQYIFLFGKALKIDEDFDIEDLETECLIPEHSEKLEEIGLALLKWISSHRGLNYDIWDEYARRQYVAKKPQANPYGEEEEPKRFRNFDIFTKLRVLHQMTVWTFWNPDRIRERMPDHPRETDQQAWRIEEFGYDSEDRQYYLLDDNRLYRRTDPPPPPLAKARPKANTIKTQAARRRASKRRRVVHSETPDVTGAEDDTLLSSEPEDQQEETNGAPVNLADLDTSGGFKWECIAITLSQYEELCDSMRRTRDPNEKALRQRIIDEVMPILEAAEERQKRKIERRERELLTLEKMATAKRSSRIADRHDREKHDQEAAEAEKKRLQDLAEARRQQKLDEKLAHERQSRMMTREQRIKDREFKRILKEEELAKAAEEARRFEAGEARGSERQLKDKLEKAKRDLEELQNEDEWAFDCSGCGVHGKNIDDGSHSLACEKCNVWQHSNCLGISQTEAEDESFHFVCKDCRRREEEASRPKITIKVRNPNSSSPVQQKTPTFKSQPQAPKQKFVGIEIPKKRPIGRPSKKRDAPNGVHFPKPQGPSTSPAPAPMQGYQYYTSQSSPVLPYLQTWTPYANGFNAQPGFSPLPNAQAPPLANGNLPRPGSSGQPYPPPQYLPGPPGIYAANSPPLLASGLHPPYYNGVPHTFQPYPPAQRPQPNPQTPYMASQTATNGTNAGHGPQHPSPAVYRPSMSPTQGNLDVGSIAGVPQRSSPMQQYAPPAAQQQRVNQSPGFSAHQNGIHPISDSRVPQPQPSHLSGISPTKHSPVAPSPHIPQPTNASPPPFHHPLNTPGQPSPALNASISPTMRSVSATALFPPAEKLAPSQDQLHKVPVPTPIKQSPLPSNIYAASPSYATKDDIGQEIGAQELRRVNEEAKENMHLQLDMPKAMDVNGDRQSNGADS